jgi:hypothetical protein
LRFQPVCVLFMSITDVNYVNVFKRNFTFNVSMMMFVSGDFLSTYRNDNLCFWEFPVWVS